MYPYYPGYMDNFALQEDDILGIRSLYGKKDASMTTTTTTTTAASNKSSKITTNFRTTLKSTTATSTKKNTQFDPTKIAPCSRMIEAVFEG
jgi:hypothetical protein